MGMAKGDEQGLAARRAALRLISAVTTEGRLLSEAMAGGSFAALPAQDRARAQRLAIEVFRQMPRADAVLAPFLKKAPPAAVQNVLRLGAVEIAGGAAAHGVVNAMVSLVAEGKRTASFKGLVNAVLRRVGEAVPAAWDKVPDPKLPNWLRQPLVAAWGRGAVRAMEEVQAKAPPLDLTVKADAEGWAERLGGVVLPGGSVRLPQTGQVSALPGYEEGAWWVQDAAAAMSVRLLGDIAGARALDLCAAPGGKTLQLAHAGAAVTAIDLSKARLRRVEENLTRTGLTAQVRQGDALQVEEGGWDVILLDAPCSATGTMRRHPDLPWAKDGSEFGALIEGQEAMLDHALGLLAPGGRLVFCTCSLLPDEGEVQVEEALGRHTGLRVLPVDLPWIAPEWHAEEGGLRVRPDMWAEQGGMDGFYMAVLAQAE